MSNAIKCPYCKIDIPIARYIPFEPYPYVCPKCARRFRLSRIYANCVGWLAIPISSGFSYLLGIRGIKLLIASAIMLIPVGFMVNWILDRFVDPPLEPYDSTERLRL
jgi:hypothetical protein